MNCESCGRDVPAAATFCPYCSHRFEMEGQERTTPVPGEILETDGWAVATFIFGVLLFVPFAFLAALPAAIVARRRLKQHPHRQGKGLLYTGLLLALFAFLGQGLIGIVGATSYAVYKRSQGPDGRSRIQNTARQAHAMNETWAFQTLRTALENYYIQNNTYPLPSADFKLDAGKLFPDDGSRQRFMYNPLQGKTYRYNSDGDNWYIAASIVPGATEYVDVRQYSGKPEEYPGLDLLYDPSKDPGGKGDIWIVGPMPWPGNSPYDSMQDQYNEFIDEMEAYDIEEETRTE